MHVLGIRVLDAGVAGPPNLLTLSDGVADLERRHRLEMDVEGGPATVVEVHAVLATDVVVVVIEVAVGVAVDGRRREHRHDGSVGRGEHGFARADVVAVAVALREVDAVLVGPVPVVRGGVPGLAARNRHLKHRARADCLGGRRGEQCRQHDECERASLDLLPERHRRLLSVGCADRVVRTRETGEIARTYGDPRGIRVLGVARLSRELGGLTAQRPDSRAR